MNNIMLLDGNLLVAIQQLFVHPQLTGLFKVITSLGNSAIIWIIAMAILIIIKKTRPIGIMVGVALLGALLIDNVILKPLIDRVRPYEVFDSVQLLISKPGDASFPSGHTGSSFAAAMVMFYKLPKKYGVPALILAILIGFSRLYLGVHYPTDVLAGAIIGTAIAFIVVRCMSALFNKRKIAR